MINLLILLIGAVDVEIQPPSLSDTLQVGQTSTQYLVLTNHEAADVSWQLAEEPAVGWLNESPTSGTLIPSGTQNISVNFTANVSPGEYSTVLFFTFICGFDTSYKFVPVSLTVTPIPEPEIWINPTSFDVSIYERDSTERTLIIGNSGNATLNWNGVENPVVNWLSEVPPNGNVAPGSYMNASLRFNGNITPGNYSTNLLILNNDPDNDTVEIPINFQVLNIPESDISINPSSFSITLTQGDDSSQTLRITNSGDAALTWNIYDSLSAVWLTVSPQQGVVPESSYADINLLFDADRLPPSSYSTILVLSSNDPFEPLIYIPCQLTVVQGLTDLSGIIHNIAFNENLGTLDSSDYVASGNVELIDTAGTIFGPSTTDIWGNYSLADIPIDNYTMRIYKPINLPQNLPLNKALDTVNVFLPNIVLNPGTNSQNGVLPVELVEQNYELLSDLARLNLVMPEWNINTILDSSYEVTNGQSLIDNWTENLDSVKIDGLGRLWLSSYLLKKDFDNLSYYGTEGSVGLAEILSLLIASEDYVAKCLEKIAGENEKLLVKYYLHLLNQYFQHIHNSIASLLPASLRKVLGDGYCQIFIDCLNNISGNNYQVNAQARVLDYTNSLLFSDYYIKQRTRDILNTATAYADSENYTGNLNLAFTIMDYHQRAMKQNLEAERNLAKSNRTLLALLDKTDNILDTFNVRYGMEKLLQIGEMLKILDFSFYIPSLASLFGKFAEIPDSLTNVIYRIYYPEGTIFANSGSRARNKFVKNSSITVVQTSLDDYNSIIELIKDILVSKNRDSLIKILPQLIETDKSFDFEFNKILGQIYSVSSIAKDSVENYVDDYESLIKSVGNSYSFRSCNLVYLLNYINNPSIENRNRAFYHLDSLKQANIDLSLQIETIFNKISQIPLPAIICVATEITSNKVFVENGDTVSLQIALSNSGPNTAQNINLTPVISSAFSIVNQPTIPTNLGPGEEKKLTYILSYSGGQNRLEGIAILIGSENAFTLSPFEPIAVIPDMTPSTGGRLISQNVYCFKNPFNPDKEETTIRFSLSQNANVTIRILDGANNEVITLLNSYPMMAKVEQRVRWSGKNAKGQIVANGVYYALITTNQGERAVCKIIVLR